MSCRSILLSEREFRAAKRERVYAARHCGVPVKPTKQRRMPVVAYRESEKALVAHTRGDADAELLLGEAAARGPDQLPRVDAGGDLWHASFAGLRSDKSLADLSENQTSVCPVCSDSRLQSVIDPASRVVDQLSLGDGALLTGSFRQRV